MCELQDVDVIAENSLELLIEYLKSQNSKECDFNESRKRLLDIIKDMPKEDVYNIVVTHIVMMSKMKHGFGGGSI